MMVGTVVDVGCGVASGVASVGCARWEEEV